ncbi:MAG: type II toxin-antitoxin system HicB family antitoxin [Niabella sp.]
MTTIALIEKTKDGEFSIYTPDVDHTIIGTGKTVKAAKADFENSVKEVLASYTDEGKSLPKELKAIKFVFKYDIASVFDEYDFIHVSKFAEYSGINASLMRQYKTKKDTYISEAQMKKIETGFHRAAKGFAAIRLV